MLLVSTAAGELQVSAATHERYFRRALLQVNTG